ncbi:hypothetical protein L861_01785 [Litchfieldella anticariensis FP35 = DSM 16096]|uniref:DUF2931 domain-containing protein n=1 Tax=Litchfieldella anticariensis (strain DSM 16096 / CECT 5854 / CIP 108499 / LMG 22089 / FP35) TaxID=1121939 RepID=S2KPM8_LITA3|nr:DUF2931 family protein [Halomonas anticariensis]EPC04062.1 hypothetical protein L861_01785 [Halomonas anticariensis FP35 = DSM 16096]
MLKTWRYVSRLGLLALLLVFTACEAEPRRYEFVVQPVGGPRGWPVWVEKLTFDHTWETPVGNLSAGFEHRPPRSGSFNVLAHPVVAPQSMQARWFSYRTQTFYEIDLELPDTEALLRQWYREYPPPKYEHDLIVGFSGEGEVLVWWQAWCSECSDRSRDFHAPIVESVYGEESEGDPSTFRSQTQRRVDEGIIPSPWQ